MARVSTMVLVLLLVLGGGLFWYWEAVGPERAPVGGRSPAGDAAPPLLGNDAAAPARHAAVSEAGTAGTLPPGAEAPPDRGAAEPGATATADPVPAEADPLSALDPQTLAELRAQHGNAPGFDDGLREMLRRDPALARLFENARPPGPPALPAPVAAAEPATYAVSWDDYDSTIVIGDEVDEQGRRIAQVETRDLAGELLVRYPAAAYRDADGNVQIDARGSPVSGPWAEHWSPDSFRIGRDHRVHVIDDAHRDHLGDANPAGGG